MFKFIQQLFQKQKIANVPFVQEILERSEREKAAYIYWKTTENKEYMIAILADRLMDSTTPATDILRLNTAKSKGFILKYNSVESDTSLEGFRHLFDYLKEQIQTLNYMSYVSDVKNFVRPKFVETIERHYLKPRFSYNEETGQSNQQYGNLLVEHLLHDEKSIHIKFVCNIYNDRKWTQPLSFDQLIQKILH